MKPGKNKRELLLVYHADCLDGIASAWVLMKALKRDYDRIIPVAYDHADEAGSRERIRKALKPGMEVCAVDVTLPLDFLLELSATRLPGALRGFDHHLSAKKAFDAHGPDKRLSGIIVEPWHASATMMLWHRFMKGKEPPPAIRLIDKMDGDAHGLKLRRDFAAAAWIDAQVDLSSVEAATPVLEKLSRLSAADMARKGTPLFREQEKRIDKLLANAAIGRVRLDARSLPAPVPIVNSNVKYFGRSVSHRMVELANKVGGHAAFAWEMQPNGVVSVSIRTDGQADSEKIAEYIKATNPGTTGGGHEHSGQVHFPSLTAFEKFLKSVLGEQPRRAVPHRAVQRRG